MASHCFPHRFVRKKSGYAKSGMGVAADSGGSTAHNVAKVQFLNKQGNKIKPKPRKGTNEEIPVLSFPYQNYTLVVY